MDFSTRCIIGQSSWRSYPAGRKNCAPRTGSLPPYRPYFSVRPALVEGSVAAVRCVTGCHKEPQSTGWSYNQPSQLAPDGCRPAVHRPGQGSDRLVRLNALGRSPMTQRLRLAAGLVLFSYVASHLLNHALGMISLEAAGAGRVWFT